jgi:hypothetical protein
MNNKISQLACRVCGKIQSDPPWGLDGQCPTYEICDCCGLEFGYGDCTPEAARAWRKHWIETGTQWKCPEERPVNWSADEQMRNIPELYQ